MLWYIRETQLAHNSCRRLVTDGVTQLANFARELRTSGSGIIVEEDLAAIFERGRISPVIEGEFKKNVNI